MFSFCFMTYRTGHDCSDKSKVDVVQKPFGQLDLFSSNEEFGGFGSSMCPGYVPLEDIVSLAIDGIYLLSVEGLKIQCSMSDQDPPSGIAPKPMDQSDALELMSFSLTLDEWLRLDHGMLDNKDQTNKQMGNKILTHHAYQDQASSDKGHTLRNKLTLALQVLLRDPFQNNEPVGASMLAMIQVERSMDSLNPPVCSLAQEGRNKESFEYDSESWRITDIGLAGLKTELGVDHPWCTKTQQQSGSRWLLASGTDKTIKYQASESKAIIVSNPQATRKSFDTLWSIMADRHHQEGDLSSSAASVPFTRNSDVIFSNEITERL